MKEKYKENLKKMKRRHCYCWIHCLKCLEIWRLSEKLSSPLLGASSLASMAALVVMAGQSHLPLKNPTPTLIPIPTFPTLKEKCQEFQME